MQWTLATLSDRSPVWSRARTRAPELLGVALTRGTGWRIIDIEILLLCKSAYLVGGTEKWKVERPKFPRVLAVVITYCTSSNSLRIGNMSNISDLYQIQKLKPARF